MMNCLKSKSSQENSTLESIKDDLKQNQVRNRDSNVAKSKLKLDKKAIEKDKNALTSAIALLIKESDDLSISLKTKREAQLSFNLQIIGLRSKAEVFEKSKELDNESEKVLMDIMSIKNEINNVKTRLNSEKMPCKEAFLLLDNDQLQFFAKGSSTSR